MLTPTNDTFFAAQGISVPHGNRTVTVTARAYDAGTELNTELCGEIPGPQALADMIDECDTPGPRGCGSSDGGFVHVHNGIHGQGDLDPVERDWRNPVARIQLRRARD